MPKRIGYIYEHMVSFDNCKNAIIEASRHKTSRREVVHVLALIDYYAADLQQRLINHDFCTPYRPKVIYDNLRKKERNIHIPAFYPDQCAHHAISRVIIPPILKSSYLYSCANIKYRGLDHGRRKMNWYFQKHPDWCKYCLKLDIYHFYESIDHDVMIWAIERKFKDKKAVAILKTLVDSFDKGIPIGNYTSSWFAELLLQIIDHLIINKLSPKGYVRYADDMVLLSPSKNKLHKMRKSIAAKLNSINLKLKANWQVFKVYKEGKGRKVDFMGVCFFHTGITIRKRRSLAFIKDCRKIIKEDYKITPRLAGAFLSRSACLLHSDTLRLKQRWYYLIQIDKVKDIVRKKQKKRQYKQLSF